jgi:2-dehydropantoate 2-reductase
VTSTGPDHHDGDGRHARALRVVVLGAGAIGGYLGGALARAGHDATLLARGEHLAVIRARGLELRTPEDGAAPRPPVRVRATDDAEALPATDLVLVAVKSYSLDDVAPAAVRLARGGALVLPLLNGVDAAERLAQHGVPRDALLGGVVFLNAVRVAPGVVERRSLFRRVVLGRLARAPEDDADSTAARVAGVVRALREADVDAHESPRIEVELWQKLAFVAPLAAACGLGRCDVGTVRDAPLGRLLIERGVAEVAAVGVAAGVALDDDLVARTVAEIDALPARLYPSLLPDLRRGGPTELDVLSGAVARRGRQLGVPTPVHDTAVAALGAATGATGSSAS